MAEEINPISLVEQAFTQMREENAQLVERLDQVQLMFQVEDQGWTRLFGGLGDDFPGLDLDQLKDWSGQIQEYLVGNPIIKRGSGLRGSYVWSKGVKIPGAERAPGKKGTSTKLERFCKDKKTQAYLLSSEANDEMERAAVATGMYLLVGEDRTKKILHPIPIDEIKAIQANPDYKGEVWAYLREWDSIDGQGKTKTQKEWIYTDRFDGTRKQSIKTETESIPVAENKTVFDQTFNSQIGWPLGVPDALSAIVWAKIYSELMNHGKVMTESLAKFAFKVTQTSQKGANNVGVKTSRGGAGQTAVIGQGNDLTPLSNAGKAYDFNGIRAVAAMVATALEVSIVHLLSDPGAAGSSYGSASNLDLPTKRAMVSRQNLWASYIERILEWATGDEDVKVTFPPLDDDPYRAVQALALIWNTGLVHEDEMRDPILEMGGITAKHDKAPDGVLLPNNKDSWERADIDPSDEPATTAASPDQGQSNGGGGTDSTLNNDTRQDTIGEMLKRFSNEEFLARLEAVAERIEAAKGA